MAIKGEPLPTPPQQIEMIEVFLFGIILGLANS
jgi:hypothetical protein